MAIDRGCSLEATDRIRRLRRVDADDPLPDRLRRRLDQVEIRCQLASGDLNGALLILHSIPVALRRNETLARVDLCAGRPDRAERRLVVADRATPTRVEIERLVLLARAQLEQGKASRANLSVHRAVELGRPERYVRVFLDDADHVLVMLRGMVGHCPDSYLSELVDHAPQATGLSNGEPCAQIVELLTGRERELLGHLPTHLSQREIATAMYLSLNTVKTHTANVYRKLGAGSRSEAVATARLHGLL